MPLGRLGLVPAAGLDAGDPVSRTISPARKVDPGTAGAAGAALLAMLLGAGGEDRLGVLEAVLAEGRELENQVDQVGRPGCCPAAFLFNGYEHRFVI